MTELETPPCWFLVFQREAASWWLRLVAMGRFKHVLAIGWLPDAERWVIYDVRLGETVVSVGPDDAGTWAVMEGLMSGNVVLRVEARGKRGRWARLGFWCVPAMLHLVGGKGCALRPDGLFAKCLRDGAEIVRDGQFNGCDGRGWRAEGACD